MANQFYSKKMNYLFIVCHLFKITVIIQLMIFARLNHKLFGCSNRLMSPIHGFGKRGITSLRYIKGNLLKTNKFGLDIKEKFIDDIQTHPQEHYLKFYNNQFNANDNNEIIVKIIADINTRLDSTSILNMRKFNKFNKALHIIRNNGIELLNSKIINPEKMYMFIIGYVETMYELLKSCDTSIKGTYHTKFTKGFMKNLCNIGNNTRLFFTFRNLHDQFLIDIRPMCMYPTQLLDIPDFVMTRDNYINNCPLIPTKQIQKQVEGNTLDLREFTFHDLGHSYVMGRQDSWLFSCSNRSAPDLVTEWIKNKNLYVEKYETLKNLNYDLYRAVKLYVFDIVHDRGYQFYLPILRQQIRAIKNLENIKTKIIRGNFADILHEKTLENIDSARQWLLDITDDFLIKDNLEKIQQYKSDGYIIKKFLDVESHIGKPISVVIGKGGKINVNFHSDGIIKTTSLYEIELLDLPTSDAPIFSEENVNNINKWINIMNNGYMEYLKLDSNGNIIDLPGKTIIIKDSTEYHLKDIEIYKLERLFKIIREDLTVKFSTTKLPDIYESENIQVNGTSIVIDTGISFNLNEISIENKPKNTLKYINLDAHNRFVSEDALRKSYIRYQNSNNMNANPYVTLDDSMELGIVDTQNNIEIAQAISSLLSRSIDDAKDIYGGYLPEGIVMRAQLEYVSPYAISNLWGRYGYRFVLSRSVGNNKREIIGTALIANSKGTLFFFTNKYNNLRASTMTQDVDFNLCVDGNHKWFDKFNFPNIRDYKPVGLNQLANFAVEKIGCRGLGLGKLLITEIVNNYAIHHKDVVIKHSQPLICGKGLFQIADPSWLRFMLNIGFKLRIGAETFYIDREWSKLPSVTMNGKEINNVEYNNFFNMPQLYCGLDMSYAQDHPDMHLLDRVPEVIELANSGYAKLQYYQLIYMFDETKV